MLSKAGKVAKWQSTTLKAATAKIFKWLFQPVWLVSSTLWWAPCYLCRAHNTVFYTFTMLCRITCQSFFIADIGFQLKTYAVRVTFTAHPMSLVNWTVNNNDSEFVLCTPFLLCKLLTWQLAPTVQIRTVCTSTRDLTSCHQMLVLCEKLISNVNRCNA